MYASANTLKAGAYGSGAGMGPVEVEGSLNKNGYVRNSTDTNPTLSTPRGGRNANAPVRTSGKLWMPFSARARHAIKHVCH